MPYIPQYQRDCLDKHIDALDRELFKLGDVRSHADGALNYVITRLLVKRWRQDTCYMNGNALMGVVACAAREFYRRFLAPHEDTKIAANGDIDEKERS